MNTRVLMAGAFALAILTPASAYALNPNHGTMHIGSGTMQTSQKQTGHVGLNGHHGSNCGKDGTLVLGNRSDVCTDKTGMPETNSFDGD